MISCSGLCRSPECFSRDRAGLGFRVIVLAPRSEVLSSAVQDQLSNVRDAQRGSSAADDEKHGTKCYETETWFEDVPVLDVACACSMGPDRFRISTFREQARFVMVLWFNARAAWSSHDRHRNMNPKPMGSSPHPPPSTMFGLALQPSTLGPQSS